MKNDWTEGYVAEVGYTHGYYNELNPLQLQLPLLVSGHRVPVVARACELGFGQGLSLNLHAAASAVQWWGTDFSPAQASFAAQALAASAANAHIFDDAFDEFCARPDLPMFDMVGLHGIWSWINDANREVIVDFLRRKLRPGGLVYISYNTWPGWSDVAPVRELMVRHSEAMGSRATGVLERVKAAFAFMDQLAATEPLCWRNNPGAKAMLDRLRQEDAHYLAHEFFNRNWQPMLFAEVADWLAPAKLGFACSANALGLLDALNLTPQQAELLKTLPEGAFRETVRDFMVNRRFRQDIWVKGGTPLSASERLAALRALPVVLVTAAHKVNLNVQGAQQTGSLQAERYQPLLNVLANHHPRTLGELERALCGPQLVWEHLVEMVTILAGKGDLAVAHSDAALNASAPASARLNQHWLDWSCHHATLRYLASPVTGGGVGVSRLSQLFLAGRRAGHTEPEACAAFCWAVLKGEGKRMKQQERTLMDDAENLAELAARYQDFINTTLPVLQVLRISP